jgi:hypothetical protein
VIMEAVRPPTLKKPAYVAAGNRTIESQVDEL